jgi:hypothetical protein
MEAAMADVVPEGVGAAWLASVTANAMEAQRARLHRMGERVLACPAWLHLPGVLIACGELPEDRWRLVAWVAGGVGVWCSEAGEVARWPSRDADGTSLAFALDVGRVVMDDDGTLGVLLDNVRQVWGQPGAYAWREAYGRNDWRVDVETCGLGAGRRAIGHCLGKGRDELGALVDAFLKGARMRQQRDEAVAALATIPVDESEIPF